MKPIVPVQFVHTTHNTEVQIFPEQVMGVFFLPAYQSVVIIGEGGACVPVLGTIGEVTSKLTAALNGAAANNENTEATNNTIGGSDGT